MRYDARGDQDTVYGSRLRTLWAEVPNDLILSVPLYLFGVWEGLPAATVGTAVTTALSLCRLRHRSNGGALLFFAIENDNADMPLCPSV